MEAIHLIKWNAGDLYGATIKIFCDVLLILVFFMYFVFELKTKQTRVLGMGGCSKQTTHNN